MSTLNSLLLPAIYALGCAAVMATFTYAYKRYMRHNHDHPPWFPQHKERDLYISLLNADPPASEIHLKSALLRRAMEDVRRLQQMQADKPALQQLLQKGAVGDGLWHQFLHAEQDLMAELQEVLQESETYRSGWNRFIMQTAAQMLEHEKQKELFAEMKIVREKEEREQKKKEERWQREAKDQEVRDKVKREKERVKAEEELLKAEEAEKAEKAEKDTTAAGKKKKTQKKK